MTKRKRMPAASIEDAIAEAEAACHQAAEDGLRRMLRIEMSHLRGSTVAAALGLRDGYLATHPDLVAIVRAMLEAEARTLERMPPPAAVIPLYARALAGMHVPSLVVELETKLVLAGWILPPPFAIEPPKPARA